MKPFEVYCGCSVTLAFTYVTYLILLGCRVQPFDELYAQSDSQLNDLSRLTFEIVIQLYEKSDLVCYPVTHAMCRMQLDKDWSSLKGNEVNMVFSLWNMPHGSEKSHMLYSK